MTNYSLDIFLFQFESVHFSVSSSNCCFLACIQVSQEACKVVWYSHLFKNFPQFAVIHTVKGFSIDNKQVIFFFLEFACFFYDPEVVGNLISDSSAFSKSILYICKFSFLVLLKPSLKEFEYNPDGIPAELFQMLRCHKALNKILKLIIEIYILAYIYNLTFFYGWWFYWLEWTVHSCLLHTMRW